MTEKTLGQVAYEGYCASTGNKSATGLDLPTWDKVKPNVQIMWEASAEAVRAALIPGAGSDSGWYGVDFDGTLAMYGQGNHCQLGDPIKPVVDYVKGLLADGATVKIVTARVSPQRDLQGRTVTLEAERKQIEDWCVTHLGQVVPITCCKDYGMVELVDDRAIQVVPNRGIRVDEQEWQ